MEAAIATGRPDDHEGAPFETQARRFASNGYPAERIEAHDYDALFTTETVERVLARLDQRIARLPAETGADRVGLVAHPLSTRLAQEYLRGSPARPALVPLSWCIAT